MLQVLWTLVPKNPRAGCMESGVTARRLWRIAQMAAGGTTRTRREKKNDVGLVRCYMGAPPGTACTPAITTVRPIEMVAEDNTEWTTSLLSRISRHAANARPS